jgi:hypothetical protein
MTDQSPEEGIKMNRFLTGKWLAVIAMVAAYSFSFLGSVYAASQTTQHTVTTTVPSLISIAADTANFTLTFSDFVTASETNTQLVNYTVKANNMTRTLGVVTGQLSALFTGMDLRADVGTYVKASGDARLVESAAGFITIGNVTAVNLANRAIDTAPGKKIRGVLPVTYKAVATADLDAGSQNQTLTISFIDT